HFHSSTTSGSASLMSLRILPRVSPRQSPSSAILLSISSDGEWLWVETDFFIFSGFLAETFVDFDTPARATERAGWTLEIGIAAPTVLDYRPARTPRTKCGSRPKAFTMSGWLEGGVKRRLDGPLNAKLGRHCPAHLMTSSARSSMGWGILISSAFAVFRLTTSSSLFGCSIGSSAGLAPLRILSTYSAARRN